MWYRIYSLWIVSKVIYQTLFREITDRDNAMARRIPRNES